jgi:hypothetical protein
LEKALAKDAHMRMWGTSMEEFVEKVMRYGYTGTPYEEMPDFALLKLLKRGSKYHGGLPAWLSRRGVPPKDATLIAKKYRTRVGFNRIRKELNRIMAKKRNRKCKQN